MQKTTFTIPKMDCASGENLIRLRLDGVEGVRNLDFDIPNRRLDVLHDGQLPLIEESIASLNLGGRVLSTEEAGHADPEEPAKQRGLLRAVLAINFSFFLVELAAGRLSGSMGLVADSLDMLADALVYGLSLFAVGGLAARKKRVAGLAGYFQLTLAAVGLGEVVRRFAGVGEPPDFSTMIVVSALALVANGTCLYLLQKAKSREAHMQASAIFTSNDVIINLGVIAAGLLVLWTDSNKPDLIIGAVVFAVVVRGALRILKLAR